MTLVKKALKFQCQINIEISAFIYSWKALEMSKTHPSFNSSSLICVEQTLKNWCWFNVKKSMLINKRQNNFNVDSISKFICFLTSKFMFFWHLNFDAFSTRVEIFLNFSMLFRHLNFETNLTWNRNSDFSGIQAALYSPTFYIAPRCK